MVEVDKIVACICFLQWSLRTAHTHSRTHTLCVCAHIYIRLKTTLGKYIILTLSVNYYLLMWAFERRCMQKIKRPAAREVRERKRERKKRGADLYRENRVENDGEENNKRRQQKCENRKLSAMDERHEAST